MPLSIRAMRYVQSALKHGSITRAAEATNVTPSAIAAALDKAEAAFEVALVTRARSKGITPTKAGRDIGRRLDDLLEQYDKLLSDVSDLQSNLSGNLAIGYNAPIAPAFLPLLTTQMHRENPNVTFTLVEGDNVSVQNGLMNGKLDVILFVEEVPNPQIETVPLVFAPTYFLCRQDHELAGQSEVEISQIVNEPLVVLDRPAARSYYLEVLETDGGKLNIVATANSTEMVRSLVASGIGVSLLNMKPREIPTYAGRNVACLPISGCTSGVTLSIGFAAGPKRRLMRLFIESCVSSLEGARAAEFIVSN